MTWNYRVIEFERDGGHWMAIHEVYYLDDKPASYGAKPAIVLADLDSGDNGTESLRWTLSKMLEASAKPVLKEKDFDE